MKSICYNDTQDTYLSYFLRVVCLFNRWWD